MFGQSDFNGLYLNCIYSLRHIVPRRQSRSQAQRPSQAHISLRLPLPLSHLRWMPLHHGRVHSSITPTHEVSPDSVPWSLDSWKFIAGHIQTESDHWLASDFNGRPNPNLGSHDCPRPPIRLPGGNDKSRFDSGHYLPIPTIPQPLGAFSQNSEAFDPAGYTDLVGLTSAVHPSENTQDLLAGHHVFRHGPCQGCVS